MMRCVGDRQARELRKPLHRALALRHVFDQLQPVRMTEHTRQRGELFENQTFRIRH